MLFIEFGAFGFLLIHLLDVVCVKRVPLVKPFTWTVGMALLGFAMAGAALQSDKLTLPGWSVFIGWGLLPISLAFLLFSLFGSLPFRKTYVNSGVGNKLVTTGLYALVRHPGVHWYVLLCVSLLLVSRSALLLAATPIWIVLDIALVIVQDRFFFGRMFPGYSNYRRTTPMLLPNRSSFGSFMRGLRRAGSHTSNQKEAPYEYPV
jgi:protein-S-isoprenylcysteine O-methyltransferase Ste14